jgi:hypothetical protein
MMNEGLCLPRLSEPSYISISNECIPDLQSFPGSKRAVSAVNDLTDHLILISVMNTSYSYAYSCIRSRLSRQVRLSCSFPSFLHRQHPTVWILCPLQFGSCLPRAPWRLSMVAYVVPPVA